MNGSEKKKTLLYNTSYR